ncbi:hypothetical protein [Ruania rhizosphaerae]|uniref:hypothetical protein n=1 Tax=Ruania rhizosphaerae TaxID=1840413 RepID=UPI0013598AC7|nr:hypothetical protein [Ruania rhizosphaerae]
MTDPLVDAAAAVYRATPAAFVQVRREQADALARDAPDAAARLRELPKPVRAAWAVNMVVWQLPERLAQLLELGEALRRAHARADAAELRTLTRERRSLVATIGGEVAALCAELDAPLSTSTLDQVNETLVTALGDEVAEEAIVTGRLVRPLSPGIDPRSVTALAEVPGSRPLPLRPGSPLVPVPSGRPAPTGTARSSRGRAERAAEIRAAERRVARLESTLERATGQVAEYDTAMTSLRTRVDETRKQWEELERELEQAVRQRQRAVRTRDQARTALAQAVDLLTAAERDARSH